MDLSDKILELIHSGFSKDEIYEIFNRTGENNKADVDRNNVRIENNHVRNEGDNTTIQENATGKTEDNAGKSELDETNKEFEKVREELSDLKKIIQANNLQKAVLDTLPEENVIDIMSKIIRDEPENVKEV